MRIKKGYFLHKVGDECIVMQDTSAGVDFTNIINLNKTAEFLWHKLENKDFDKDIIARALLENYEVSETTAAADADKFAAQLRSAGVLE